MATVNNPFSRLMSLDALRGFTIMAMIVVNDPGSWDHVYAPLLHAEWNGVTPTDYIFPFFLFIVGVSVVLAYRKRLDANADKTSLAKKAAWRALKIYLVGLFLWLWPQFDFGEIRWTGVLQRISFVFLPCTLLFLYTGWRTWLRVGIGTLVAYWLLMAFVPVPGIGAPDLSVPEKNWAHYLDSIALPGVLWQKTWDPEGILSTFPAIVTGITGMLAGQLILTVKDDYRRLSQLFFAGFIMLTLGEVWSWFFPLNKNIWTSSYVLHTSGLAFMALAASMYIIDLKGYTRWIWPGLVFGANAITAYVLAGMLTTVFYTGFGDFPGLNQLRVEGLSGAGLPARLASLLYALLYTGVVFVPVYWLYRKKIFVKL
jgi:predicted acyltransferase